MQLRACARLSFATIILLLSAVCLSAQGFGSYPPSGGVPGTSSDISTPGAPASGKTRFYTKGGKLCSLDPSNNENCTGGTGGGGIISLNTLTGATQTFTNDTNITVTSAGTAHAFGWTGTLAAARLNSNVVQSIVNDTNVTGAISAQALTIGWTGILAGARGGTGNGFFAIAGPASSLKTHTWPNQSINWTSLSGVGKWTAGVPSIVTLDTDVAAPPGSCAPTGPSAGSLTYTDANCAVFRYTSSSGDGNISGGSASGFHTGKLYTFEITADGTRTFVFPTFITSPPPFVNIAAKTSVVTCYWDGSACNANSGTNAGFMTCTPVATPGTNPPSGQLYLWCDNTSGANRWMTKDSSGVTKGLVGDIAAVSNQFLTSIVNGVATLAQPAFSNIANFATRAQGGLNSTSAGTGILRDGSTPSASELSGDCATSGSNAVTCTKINNTSVPTNAAADQVLVTTASATGAWRSVADCVGAGGVVQYATASHAWSCHTLTGADLPNPGASAKGGIQSKDCTGTGHVLSLNTDGTVTCSSDSGGGGGSAGTPLFSIVAPSGNGPSGNTTETSFLGGAQSLSANAWTNQSNKQLRLSGVWGTPAASTDTFTGTIYCGATDIGHTAATNVSSIGLSMSNQQWSAWFDIGASTSGTTGLIENGAFIFTTSTLAAISIPIVRTSVTAFDITTSCSFDVKGKFSAGTASGVGESILATNAKLVDDGAPVTGSGAVNAITQWSGANTLQSSGIQESSGIVNSAAGNTTPIVYAGGRDASANSALGAATLRGGNQTGAGGSSSQGGGSLHAGGSNAATNTASVAGSVEIKAGPSTGASSTGLQGLMILAQSYAQSGTVTPWNLVCFTATAKAVTDCGASPSNISGVALSLSSTIQVSVAATPSEVPVNASAAVTIGHTVCAGTTAGKVTDSGGTTPCATGITVGVVIATTGTWPSFPDGTAFPTLTTSLPLVRLANRHGVGTGDIAANAVGSAQEAVVNTYRTCTIVVGSDDAPAVLVNTNLGPQKNLCKVTGAATVVEIDVNADAGTSNVIVGLRHCTTFTANKCSATSITNLLSGALAATTGGFDNCANTGGTTGLDAGTTCTSTLQNTTLPVAGDYFELVSGTADATSKRMTVTVIYKVN